MTMTMAVSLAACGSDTQGDTGSAAGTSQAAETTAAGESTATAPTEKQDVSLTMWGAEEDQALLQSMIDSFTQHYADYANFNIQLGV